MVYQNSSIKCLEGELSKLYNSKTEEEKLINKEIGKLPEHVKLIYPDTEIINFLDEIYRFWYHCKRYSWH